MHVFIFALFISSAALVKAALFVFIADSFLTALLIRTDAFNLQRTRQRFLDNTAGAARGACLISIAGGITARYGSFVRKRGDRK